MLEIWKPVVTISGYEVSNLGQIRSLDRIRGNGRFRRGAILHQFDELTYNYVHLRNNAGTRSTKLVHLLVAQAFVPNPNNLSEVIHIDRDRSNNHSTNLEWSVSINAK